jgi:hypothetical protein
MPGTDGIEGDRDTCRGLPSKLILTTFDLDEYVYASLRQWQAAAQDTQPDAPAAAILRSPL